MYRDLVTLRDNLPIVVVNDDEINNNNNNNNDDRQKNVHATYDSNLGGSGNDRNDHSEHFRYEGERAGAEAHLQGSTIYPLIHYYLHCRFIIMSWINFCCAERTRTMQ